MQKHAPNLLLISWGGGGWYILLYYGSTAPTTITILSPLPLLSHHTFNTTPSPVLGTTLNS